MSSILLLTIIVVASKWMGAVRLSGIYFYGYFSTGCAGCYERGERRRTACFTIVSYQNGHMRSEAVDTERLVKEALRLEREAESRDCLVWRGR